MQLSTLKTSAFVEYFSHLPPDEAASRCANLQIAMQDICGDVDNWKAYVARRYGFKYSVQRPDLLTAEEWIDHARILETVYPYLPVTNQEGKRKGINRYSAVVDETGDGILHKKYRRPPGLPGEAFIFGMVIYLPGLPIVISARTREFKYHVVRFEATGKMANPEARWTSLPSLDVKHPSMDVTMFESAELCQQWYLELFIPYYSFYIDRGYTVLIADYRYALPNDPFKPLANLQEILAILPVLFGEINRAFDMYILLSRTVETDGRDPIGSQISFQFRYIPCRLP